MASSQSGGGAYNQLVFDDSPGQARVALQRHGKAHDGSAELNLGHLRHQTDNQRLDPAGFGAELKTAHSATLRAGQGMLLASDARRDASGSQLDSQEAAAQIEQRHQMQVDLAALAQQHNARLPDEPAAADLPALARLAHSAEVIRATGASTQGGAVAYSEPQLQLSSPAGIAATTPADAIFASGGTSNIAAGQDINLAAQGNALLAVKDGVSLFSYGKASGFVEQIERRPS